MKFARLGLVPYRSALTLMRRLAALRADEEIDDVLLMCEHPPTITLGTSARREHLLRTEREYARAGIEVVETDRGGGATYHGPGQAVAYPIAKLGPREIVSWLAHLQKVVLSVLAEYGIEGVPDPARAGIRVGGEKIAAFGIRIARRVAYHGFALNVDVDLGPFADFVPCSTPGDAYTSMERLLGAAPRIEEVEEAVGGAFGAKEEIPPVELWLRAFDGPDFPPVSALPRPGAKDRAGPKPGWLKRPFPSGPGYARVAEAVKANGLHTVCESAQCPNLGECWSAGTATIMLLGETCTRACGFCAVRTGRPEGLDEDEPARVAEAVARMGISYVVLTSVNRDDLPDGGARIWAETIRAVRERVPGVRIEALVPDFLGDLAAFDTVLDAEPDVLNHNLETVPRLYPTVRPKARYERSLSLLARAAEAGLPAKSGVMLGLGEAPFEVEAVLSDLARAGVSIVTLGQYLRPSPAHLPVDRWVHPSEFAMWKAKGEAMGIAHVEAGPLVRSSYHAEKQARIQSNRPTHSASAR